jgi:hypothetical protein
MIEQRTRRGLEFGALRGAIEACDPDALLSFYAEGARLRVVHASLPGGPTFELRGREQIGRYLRAIGDQEMDCLVEEGARIGEGRVEFTELCRYPNGVPISFATTLEVEGGLISSQTDVVRRADREEGGDR